MRRSVKAITKEGISMQELQKRTMQIFIQPQNKIATNASNHSDKSVPKRIGIAEDETLYAPNYDIDEYNDEIAKMFGTI